MSQANDDETWTAGTLLIVGFFGVSLLLGGFGVWAALSGISGAVIAQGQVEVERNRQVVQHPDGGVVEEVFALDGSVVSAGEVLLRLDARDLLSDLAVVEGQLFEVLARRARLEAERDGTDELVFDPVIQETDNPMAVKLMRGQQNLFEARRATDESEIEQLSRQKEQIADEIEGLEAQRAASQEQLEISTEELEKQVELLDRGLAQAFRVYSVRRDTALLTGQTAQLAAQIAASEGRITELDIEILRLQTTRREDAIATLRDLQFNEIELSETRRQIVNRLERLEIKAPVAGVIHDLRVFGESAVIRPAEPVLFIVPQDRPLIITARVRPQDIDEVVPGQEVRVRLSSFNQRTLQELFGEVEFVSADAYSESNSDVSFYRARIVLYEGELNRLPEGQSLLPGMPVDVFLSTDERTPLEYLVKPISDYFATSFRES
ncbi:MAG: HlyD family type I secretion periplasmic adaptor subunit [Pseudomonadota bacterium]